MISQQELQQRLREMGWSVSLRQLTDWRSKGLLPPLASRGRGKGLGKVYFWKEPDIVVRAQVLHHAFANRATAEIAILSLVHAGFVVPPKTARRTWIKILARQEKLSEKRIEPGETPRDASWNQALQIVPEIDKGDIPTAILEPLTAEALVTIYARRGFRPTPEELGDVTDAANQYLTAMMAASRHSDSAAPVWDQNFVRRLLEIVRKALSVTATKELLKGTSIEQFDQAISATRQMLRVVETFVSTQMQGKTISEPILEIRMIFRAILGARMTAFFLQLVGEGYGQKLQKSLRLAELLISSCEADSGSVFSKQNPEISEELQRVIKALFSDFKEIWRDSDLFRLYHVA